MEIMKSDTVTLAHGAGGKQTSELIDRVFKRHFVNPLFTADDAAVIEIEKGRIAMSTDGFIVSPWEFNGGNIGKLSICGTVNDLACMGAKPLYLTCSYIVEEGFPVEDLEKIAQAMGETCRKAGVKIVAGDTKVAGKGQVDKVFITTTEGSENTLSVTGTFKADGETNTDAVIYSKEDLVLNGKGTLTVTSAKGNGITSKDDLKITGGTLNVTAALDALEANDSIVIYDGSITVNSKKDGLHAENDEDDSLGYIWIGGGTLTVTASDDAIHGTSFVQVDGGTITVSGAEGIEGTYIQINDGTIHVTGTDDGLNGANKSSAYETAIEIAGGTLNVTVGQGDTDAIDSNGNLYVTGGVVNITASSSFDYDGTATYTGGTIIVNGQTVNSITNSMMGGMGNMQMGGRH